MSSVGQKILIIEDEPDVAELISRQLKKANFAILVALDGKEGINTARTQRPALIILDLMLPRMPGLEVCRALKSDSSTRHIPVMMLTARAEETDRIVGFELGADDYVTKPFSPREVVLRTQAILRRNEGPSEEQSIVAGPITIDGMRHLVVVNGKVIRLTSLEFKLLRTLAQRRGRVQDRDRLLNDVWGYENVESRTVDTHMRRLREKLGQAGDAIETVRGFGYRFREHF